MTEQDFAPGTEPDSPPGTAGTADDPWLGIPAQLLDPNRAYDTDTAGGCG